MADEANAVPAQWPGEKPLLTFGIAMKTVDDAAEWRFRCRMLSATLRSVFGQTDSAFHVMVAVDRPPEIEFPTDVRFEFVPFKGRPTSSLNAAHIDQAAKLFAIATLVARRGGSYFMPLDMDDFVSRDLVAFVRANPDPNGYVMESGYGLDGRTNKVAALFDAGGRFRALNKVCGTSAIINLAPEDVLSGGARSRYFRLRAEGHFMMREGAAAEARPLMSVPFRAVVYTVFHGSNLSNLVSAGDLAARQKIAQAIEAEGVPSSALTNEFSLPDCYPLIHDFTAAALGIFPKIPGPTLSVAISTYRRPAGLRRLLTALRPQVAGRPGREIVVVNDGSHDEAYEAVRTEFADIIKYAALPKNGGIAEARNATVKLASRDYVVFTDDDCEPPPWWLDWLAARLIEAPELEVVAGTTRALPPERWRFFAKVLARHGLLPMPLRQQAGIHFVTANVAIRRSLFDKIGGFGFPGPFHGAGEDTEFASRAVGAGTASAVDDLWFVRHEVESTFWSSCRRQRRYGYVNVALMPLTTSPQSNDDLDQNRRRRHPGNWLRVYRRHRRFANEVSDNRFVRMLSALTASLVTMAYLDGCAAALRDRDRRRAQRGAMV